MEKNIYQKLAKVRVDLQEKDLKKSGKNEFAKFTYYELGDFLPQVNALFNEQGLLSVFNVTRETASLTIFDSESKDTLVFETYVAEAELGGKNGNPIQKLGATHTYLKRYLFLNALEIVEADQVDAIAPVKKESEHEKMRQVFNKKYGDKTNQVLNWVAKDFGYESFKDWKPKDVSFTAFKERAIDMIKEKQKQKDELKGV